MGNLGPWEIALIVLAILLIFGPKKLPGVGRSLGRGMREFKDSVGDTAKELKDATADTPAALRDGFNPKQGFKEALNPFAEEKQEEEVLDGEIVAPTASPPAPEGQAESEPEPEQDEAPAAASSERT
jgi:sec-independent protein translocase protein TatA